MTYVLDATLFKPSDPMEHLINFTAEVAAAGAAPLIHEIGSKDEVSIHSTAALNAGNRLNDFPSRLEVASPDSDINYASDRHVNSFGQERYEDTYHLVGSQVMEAGAIARGERGGSFVVAIARGEAPRLWSGSAMAYMTAVPDEIASDLDAMLEWRLKCVDPELKQQDRPGYEEAVRQNLRDIIKVSGVAPDEVKVFVPKRAENAPVFQAAVSEDVNIWPIEDDGIFSATEIATKSSSDHGGISVVMGLVRATDWRLSTFVAEDRSVRAVMTSESLRYAFNQGHEDFAKEVGGRVLSRKDVIGGRAVAARAAVTDGHHESSDGLVVSKGHVLVDTVTYGINNERHTVTQRTMTQPYVLARGKF
jgi:hypothetical protein